MTDRGLFDPALQADVEKALHGSPPASGRAALAGVLRASRAGVALEAPRGAGAALTVARTIATLAWVNMSTAFSFWAHRMVVTYLEESDDGPLRPRRLEALRRMEIMGSTALAAAMTARVTGAPLPITASAHGDGLELTGSIAWASNLFAGDSLLVTAAELPDHGRRIVALQVGDGGVEVGPFPVLVDLQDTASSSIRLNRVRVPLEGLVAVDFDRFIGRVRPRFLAWQAAFCWGLAARSIEESAPLVRGGVNEVFAAERADLHAAAARLEVDLVERLAADERSRGHEGSAGSALVREVLALRLEAAKLAGTATQLEAKAKGGRGYVAKSETARRVREAAFLPIQAPTEGQLRWELSRSS